MLITVRKKEKDINDIKDIEDIKDMVVEEGRRRAKVQTGKQQKSCN